MSVDEFISQNIQKELARQGLAKSSAAVAAHHALSQKARHASAKDLYRELLIVAGRFAETLDRNFKFKK